MSTPNEVVNAAATKGERGQSPEPAPGVGSNPRDSLKLPEQASEAAMLPTPTEMDEWIDKMVERGSLVPVPTPAIATERVRESADTKAFHMAHAMLGSKHESCSLCHPAIATEGDATLFPPLGDRALHFEDDQVMEAVTGTDHLKNSLRGRLNHMTTGEKWSLYRAVVKLASPNPHEGELSELEKKIGQLELTVQMRDAVISMAVARLGGIVEGNPTGRHNFLQRIDELIAMENRSVAHSADAGGAS